MVNLMVMASARRITALRALPNDQKMVNLIVMTLVRRITGLRVQPNGQQMVNLMGLLWEVLTAPH